MNEELAEMAAKRPPSPPPDPPLREFTPMMRRLTDIADLLAKQIAVVAHIDPATVQPIQRPRTAITLVMERHKKASRSRMVDKLLPSKRAVSEHN